MEPTHEQRHDCPSMLICASVGKSMEIYGQHVNTVLPRIKPLCYRSMDTVCEAHHARSYYYLLQFING